MSANRLAKAIKHTLAKRRAESRSQIRNAGISDVTNSVINDNSGSTNAPVNQIPNIPIPEIKTQKPANQIEDSKDEREEGGNVEAASLGIARNDQFKMPSDDAEDGASTLADKVKGFVSGLAASSPKLSRTDEFSPKSLDVNEIESGISSFMSDYAQAAPATRNDSMSKESGETVANAVKSTIDDAKPGLNEFVRSYGETNPTFSRNQSDVKMNNGESPTPNYEWMSAFAQTPSISREQNDIATSDGEVKQDAMYNKIGEFTGDIGRKHDLRSDPNREQYLDEYEQVFASEPQYDRTNKDPWVLMRDDRFDNGSGNTESHLTDQMSGEQYIKYRNAGIPGRPIEEIDPNGSYSKMDEYSNYGFIPYAPDQYAINGMMLQNVESIPSKVFNEVSNLREYLFPYKATINGKTINGSDFDVKKADTYIRSVQEEFDNPESSYLNPEANHEGMTGYTPEGYTVTYSDGTTENFPGGGYQIIKQPSVIQRDNGELVVVDPTIAVEFKDGSVIQFDDENDYRNSMQVSGYRPSNEGEEEIYWVPDFVTDDGVSLTYPELLTIVLDEDAEDTSDGITYDMNIGGLGTPKRLLKGITEGGNLPANFFDIVTSSAPYFYWPTSIARAGSDASIALSGNAPMETDRYGVGSQIAENLNADKYLSNIAFNASMPITERLAGGIGGNGKKALLNPNKFIHRKLGGTAAEPLAIAGADIAGEGLEEVFGNVFEEGANSGVLGWYANDAVDENGKPVYDRTGHVVKDYSTGVQPRLRNYFGDAPEAFVGGALLGGAHRIPQIVRSDIPETRRRIIDNREARQNGLLPYRYETNDDVEFVLPDSLVARYEREGDR